MALNLRCEVLVEAPTLFGLGRFPRLTALVLSASIVPTTLAGHRFWEHTDPTERFGQISNFLKNAGLLKGEIDPPRVCYCINPTVLRRLKDLVAGL